MKLAILIILLIPVFIFQSFIISDVFSVLEKTVTRKTESKGEIYFRERRTRRTSITAIK